MNEIKALIESGILELYVSGNTTAAQTAMIEEMALIHREIEEEISVIAGTVADYALLTAIAPNPTIKAFLLATVDYGERIKNGEAVSHPPMLHEQSSIADYQEWLSRDDMTLPSPAPALFAKIIGYTEKVTTAIVWIKELAPQEVHLDEIEKFLIVEGTCDISIGTTVHPLCAGDILSIPLYQNHFVTVTSAIACKVILQRIAA